MLADGDLLAGLQREDARPLRRTDDVELSGGADWDYAWGINSTYNKRICSYLDIFMDASVMTLRDYIDHGTHDEGGSAQGQRLLSFDRDVETAIYNTLPDNLESLLKTHPLQCPSAFIGGRQSVEMKQVGMAMTQKITQGRIMMLDGSHLFPMEKPLATAAAIEAALLNFMG